MADLLIVLPEKPVPADAVERAKKVLAERFEIPDIAVGSVETDAELMVFFDGAPIPDRQWRPGQRIYRYIWSKHALGGRGPLRKVFPDHYTRDEYPQLGNHIFNRLGHHKHGFVYYPYGTLYHDAESGQINEFGFRVRYDERALSARPPNHKLIVIFGGSAAFSVYSTDTEMFSARLENMLSERDWEGVQRPTFTVLNFGMHDYVLFQEMISYFLFVQKLRPDVVISHSGHNEFWYGMRNDNRLVSEHGIVYQAHHENWAELIHDWPDEHPTDELPIELNMPHVVLKATLDRVRQFRTAVESNGGKFIWGLQPLIERKGGLHPVEKDYLNAFELIYANYPRRRKFYTNIRRLMSMVSDAAPGIADLRIVDVYKAFGGFGADRELMWDHMHTSPAGDEEIAAIYCRAVADCLEPVL